MAENKLPADSSAAVGEADVAGAVAAAGVEAVEGVAEAEAAGVAPVAEIPAVVAVALAVGIPGAVVGRPEEMLGAEAISGVAQHILVVVVPRRQSTARRPSVARTLHHALTPAFKAAAESSLPVGGQARSMQVFVQIMPLAYETTPESDPA